MAYIIQFKLSKVGEMFIVCGVLYAVESVTERSTKIRLALDLYRNTVLEDANLSFTNPFKRTTTVGYNHRSKVSFERIFFFVWTKMKCFVYRNCTRGTREISLRIQRDITKSATIYLPVKRLTMHWIQKNTLATI